jgi:hypothetical protein
MLGFMPLSAAPMSSLGLAITIAASAGSFAVSGHGATWQRSLAHPAGAYAVAGQDAELDPSLFFRAQTGDFTTAGQSASFRRSAVSAAGAFQTTGQAATLLLGQALEADAGAFSTTGQAVIFRIGTSVPAAVGAYAVTGQTARARYVLHGDVAQLGTASPQWPMASQPMSSLGPVQPTTVGYLIQSTGTVLQASRRSEAGAYIFTGFPVRFVRGPVFRVRGQDRSGGYVMALDASGGYVSAADRSAGYVAGRDFSEGLP